MSTSRRTFLAAAGILPISSAFGFIQDKTADPLPSWNEGAAKTAILEFVRKTTTQGSADFVGPADRIAVFDNDGTLWPEDPVPFEVAFSFDMAKAMMAKKPELKDKPAYKALET